MPEDDNEPPMAGKEQDRRLDKYLRVHGEWMQYPDESSKININTASYRVLISLTDDISEETVQEIIKKRNLEPFKTVDEISAFTGKGNTVNSLLTVKSHIFKITITSANLNGRYKSVYYYDRDNKKILYCSGEY
jgi:type II secretory pathway component PulK